MGNSIKGKSALKVTGIDKYCETKRHRETYTFRITAEGKGVYLVDNQETHPKDFEAMFPLDLIHPSADKGGHCNGLQESLK